MTPGTVWPGLRVATFYELTDILNGLAVRFSERYGYKKVREIIQRAALLIASAFVLLQPCPLQGQDTPGVFRGRMIDSLGTPVPEVSVTARNVATGSEQNSRTGNDGRFEIAGAAPGVYEIEATLGGNSASLRQELRAGEEAATELVLGEEAAPQNPAQQGGDTASAASVQRIDSTQLSGLPLNGRSYNQLATLQAGVTETSSASASRRVGGGNLTVAGGRATSNNFLLDGTNIMDSGNQVPRSAAGVQLGSDAVYEVQVFSTYYGPEHGRGAGGVVNSISHSGTPEFHGTAFEYLRNSKLDARNFFDPEAEPPPFKRNQFGFTLTGPVRKDSTFFLMSFEGLRDRLSETQVDHYPDERARLGFPDADGNPTIAIHPAIPQYLTLYPLPNSTRLRNGIAENRATVFLPTNEVFFTTRVDHKISDRDSLFVRYTFDDASSFAAGSSSVYQTEANSRQQYVTLVGTHIFSLAALTALRVGYTRPTSHEDSVGAVETPPALYFIPGAPKFGNISVSGLSNFGPGNGHPAKNITNTFQIASDTLLQKGPHALKWGVQAHRYRWDSDSNHGIGGLWNFNSLESFLQGGPAGTSATAALPGSDKAHSYRQTLVGLYLQDTVTLRPNLQLSLGLRYEYTTLLYDRLRHTAYAPDPWHDSAAVLGPFLKDNPSGKDFAPRVGITWSPGNGGNTVIGVGFGLYSDPFLRYVLFGGRDASAPYYQRGTKTNFDSRSVFPNAAEAIQGEGFDVRAMDYSHPNQPMVLRYTASLQQQFPQDWRFQATYVGTRANHLYRGYDATLFPHPVRQSDGTLLFPPNLGSLNPAFSLGFGITSMDGQSFFNALQLSGGKRTGGGISVQGSYSFSHSVDDSSTPSGVSTQYGFERTLSRGLSDFDIRHRISFNYLYPLPIGGGRPWWNTGILSKAFGGWRIGGILSLRSGTPFTPTVSVRTPDYLFAATQPDLLAGQSNNPISGVSTGCLDPRSGLPAIEAGHPVGGPDLYFDPCSFAVPLPGTIGNTGRNTLIAPWVFNVDVSVQREFAVDSKRSLQFRAEIFNVPNRANFGQALSGVFSSTFPGRLNPTAGRINSTITTSRQIQFVLRFSF